MAISRLKFSSVGVWARLAYSVDWAAHSSAESSGVETRHRVPWPCGRGSVNWDLLKNGMPIAHLHQIGAK